MCDYLLELPADVSASYLATVTEFVPQKHCGCTLGTAQVREKHVGIEPASTPSRTDFPCATTATTDRPRFPLLPVHVLLQQLETVVLLFEQELEDC